MKQEETGIRISLAAIRILYRYVFEADMPGDLPYQKAGEAVLKEKGLRWMKDRMEIQDFKIELENWTGKA